MLHGGSVASLFIYASAMAASPAAGGLPEPLSAVFRGHTTDTLPVYCRAI